ncbi:MAG: lysylphosphatidylglycerol synthase domain-containing protein [Gemmatimonadales bacterium]
MKRRWLPERWWRWIQAAAGLAVLGFVIRHVVRNWAAIRAEPIAWEFNPLWIGLSLGLVLATYALQAESWRRMLAGWGPRLRYLVAARVWVLSSMGKYLPGKVWAIAGMAVMAQRRGVAPATATASAVLLQVVSIGTGALLVGATGVAVLETHRPGARVALLLILAASLAVLVFAMTPGVVRVILKRFGISPEQRVTPRPAALGFGLAANLAAWGGYGLALWSLARGVVPSANLPVPDAIGAFAGSYIAGFLFLLAPGGLGVREGVMLWMLEDRIGPANALALAALSRIGLTVADILAALPFLLTRTGSDREPP